MTTFTWIGGPRRAVPTSCGSDSGRLFWYQADALTGLSDGDHFATWTDQSGQGRNLVQNTSAAQFVYKTGIQNGKPVARLSSHAKAMAIPSFQLNRPGSLSGGRSFYLVGSYTPDASQMVAISAQSSFGGFSIELDHASDKLSFLQSHVAAEEVVPAVAGWQVLAFVADWANQQLRIYRNGALLHTESGIVAGSDTDSVWTIGDPGGSVGFVGDLGELQGYAVPHADSTVMSYSRCLMVRWAVR